MKARIDFPDGDGGRLALAFSQPRLVLTAACAAQVPAVIDAAEAAARDGAWVVGSVAYEAAAAFDGALPVGVKDPERPLAVLAVYDNPDPPAAAGMQSDFTCSPWLPAMDENLVRAKIDTIRRGIADGDYYQVNLTAPMVDGFTGDPAALYESLRRSQPGGYCAFLDQGDTQVLSASPELFFDWRPDGTLTTRPMKGTAPRCGDDAADQVAAAQLLASEKERAENLMITDLLRNDLARVALTGSVRVPRLFEIEALPTAWQMTSTVQCRTRPHTGLADIFAALFPCGSVTGAPKAAAMAAIAELEDRPRGVYCGAIGLLRPGGHASFSVAIRTVVVGAGRAECGVGSGITYDSDGGGEYAEWLVKRRFLLRASAPFKLLETLRLEAGRYPLLLRHRARLMASAAHFGFAVDEARVLEALQAVAAEQTAGSWRVRLLVDREGRCTTEKHALEANPTRIEAALAETPVDAGDEFLRHKTTQRNAYRRHAPPAGLFDTLLWNTDGDITEFTRGNVVVELDGRRVTPPLACGLLPGVLRAELLAKGEIVEQPVSREALRRATGLWFINGLRGWIPVHLTGQGQLR